MSDSSPVWGWIIADLPDPPADPIDTLERQLEDQEELIETLTARLAYLLMMGNPEIYADSDSSDPPEPPIGSVVSTQVGEVFVRIPRGMSETWMVSGGWWLTGTSLAPDGWWDLVSQDLLELVFSPGWLQ